MASADFWAALRAPCGTLTPLSAGTAQTSRGKFDRLPRTRTRFTAWVLDGYGLREHGLTRPTAQPCIGFLFVATRFCFTLPSDPTSR